MNYEREREREKKRFWISFFCEYLNATFDFEYRLGRDQVVIPALLQARNTNAVLCRIEYSKYKHYSFLKRDGYERQCVNRQLQLLAIIFGVNGS